jgi:citrate lyase synthetase
LPAARIKLDSVERTPAVAEKIVPLGKEIGSEPISASRARKLLDVGNFEELRKLVPEPTYCYLRRFKKLAKPERP